MQTLNFHTVDVFTSQPFTGNPLSIVLEADKLDDRQMQTMAREFNLPETIFVQTPDNDKHTAKVRIFTPAAELPFAGHPTIGCAIFLAEQKQDDKADFKTTVTLEEQAGLVPVEVSRTNGHVHAQLSAPVIPKPVEKPSSKLATDTNITLNKETAAKTLGINEDQISSSDTATMAHAGGPTFLFIALSNKAVLSKVRALEPMATQLSHAYGATGIYVYHLDAKSNVVNARMFAPAAGIPEDPATGSATALLASQLNGEGQLSHGNNTYTLMQGYDMSRPSDLQLDIEFDASDNAPAKGNGILSVKVAGSSVPISSGHMRIPEPQS